MVDNGTMKNQFKIHSMRRSLCTVIVFASLAGCGGGGGAASDVPMMTSAPTPVTTDPVTTPVTTPTTTDPVTIPTTTTNSGKMAAQAALITDYSPITYTELSTIPVSGGAEYNGYLGGTLSNKSDAITDSIVGDMSLSITFASTSPSVTGTATNFRDADDAVMTGSLTFSSGNFDRNGDPDSDATLTLSANGTLRDAQNNDLVFGGQLEGDFLGSQYDAVGGEVLGRVTQGGVDQNFDGTFIAER
jgi:hypothetical protein